MYMVRSIMTELTIMLATASPVHKSNITSYIHMYLFRSFSRVWTFYLHLPPGSYGESVYTGYQPEKVPLLDRGWVLVYCHVRGGGEKGRHWYYSGLGKNKHNTFEVIHLLCMGNLIEAYNYYNMQAHSVLQYSCTCTAACIMIYSLQYILLIDSLFSM